MQTDLRGWTVKDSTELYNVNGWGRGFFSICDASNVVVTPAGAGSPAIDLKELVDDLRSRGLNLPLLIRFSDILKTRVEQLFGAFQQAIAENEYKGSYRGVYPIKVNQQRHVVEELMEYGRPFGLWIETGSKPELLVALALQSSIFIEIYLSTKNIPADTKRYQVDLPRSVVYAKIIRDSGPIERQ